MFRSTQRMWVITFVLLLSIKLFPHFLVTLDAIHFNRMKVFLKIILTCNQRKDERKQGSSFVLFFSIKLIPHFLATVDS